MGTVFTTAWSQSEATPATPVTSTALPTAASAEIDTSGQFNSEVLACRTGRTPQAQSTCLSEAHAAQAERRAGRLANGTPQLIENALQRCAVFKAEEKSACEARVTGVGTSQGSVGSGGVIRQLETVTVPVEGPK